MFSLIILSSFRDLDKAEADLNEIGRGDREGFADEHLSRTGREGDYKRYDLDF
jgi:hypothetical protein